MNRGNPLGLGLILVGATLVGVATFLPLIEPIGMLGVIQKNTLIQHDGLMYVVGAIALAAAGFRSFLNVKDWPVPLIISLVGVLGILVWAQNPDLRTLYPVSPGGEPDASAPGRVADWGIAIYVATLGVLLGIVGSITLRQGVERSEKRKCPDCAETILADAKVCKHCGYRFATSVERDGASYLKPPSHSDGETLTVICFKCSHRQEVWDNATIVPCEECGTRMRVLPEEAG